MWTPPGGGRTIPFAWSNRLTAALATVCQEEYLDVTAEYIARLITESAELAKGLDSEAIDFCTLRSTGASFFADTGFPPHRVSELIGEPVSVAREFTRHEAGDARMQLFRLFSTNAEEAVPEETYTLVTNPNPFERESFDPTTYDSEWRISRSEQVTQDEAHLHNPRPVTNPTETTIDASNLGTRQHLSTDSDAVCDGNTTTTLREWVHSQETARRNGSASPNHTPSTQSDSNGQSSTTEVAVTDPQEYLESEPLFTAETSVACDELADGTPVNCQVFIDSQSVLLIYDDAQMAPPEAKQINLDSVVGQSIDYVPSQLTDIFDSTVALAYDEGEGRQIAVIELRGNQRMRLANEIFKQVLSECPVYVTHPAKRGGRVTDKEPVDGHLSVDDRSLSITTSIEEEPNFNIDLSDIMYIDTERQHVDGEERWSLLIKHLSDNSGVSSKILPRSDRKYKLLRQFAKREYRRRKQKIKQLSLDTEQKEALVALYSASNQMDMSAMLSQDASELQSTLDGLANSGLVRTGSTGAELTGLGRVVVNEKIEDVNM
jgi:helix-turn-helix protein